jgi:hypothetical protein
MHINAFTNAAYSGYSLLLTDLKCLYFSVKRFVALETVLYVVLHPCLVFLSDTNEDAHDI